MTKPREAASAGLTPHWKIRVVLPGALLHLASKTEPSWERGPGHLASLRWDPLEGYEYGDTLGFVKWEDVVAVSWRYTP